MSASGSDDSLRDVLISIQLRASRKRNHAPITRVIGPIVKTFPHSVTVEQITECLRLCCESRSSTITLHALHCFSRLAAEGWYSETAEIKHISALNLLVESVCGLYGTAATEIQKAVVQCLLNVVSSPNFTLSGPALARAVQVTRALSLLGKSEDVLKEARGALSKMTQVTCERLRESLDAEDQLLSSPTSAPRAVVGAGELSPEARTAPTEATSADAEPPVRRLPSPAPEIAVHSPSGILGGSTRESKSADSTPTIPRPATVSFDSLQPPERPPRRSSASFMQLGLGPVNSTSRDHSPRFTLDGRFFPRPSFLPEGGGLLPLPQENFIRVLECVTCVVKVDALYGEEAEALESRSRTQTAELVGAILRLFGEDAELPFLVSRVLGQVCIAAVVYALCNPAGMLNSALAIFLGTVQLRAVRRRVKHEVTVLLARVLLPLLRHTSASFPQRMAVLAVVQKLCESAEILSELFVNNDCDKHCIAVLERMVIALTQLVSCDHTEKAWVSPFQSTVLQHRGLSALLTVLRSLVSLIDLCEEEAPEWLIRSFNMVRARMVWNSQGWKAGLVALRRACGEEAASNPAAVADFLMFAPGLDKSEVGRFFGANKPFNMGVYEEYLGLFQFADRPLDMVLREIFTSFRILGEGQVVERLVEKFGGKYAESNPSLTADAAYFLGFTIFTLNTVKHNPNAKSRDMSKDEFCSILRGQNAGGNFNPELLHGIYDRVCQHEIRIDCDTDPTLSFGAEAVSDSLGAGPVYSVASVQSIALMGSPATALSLSASSVFSLSSYATPDSATLAAMVGSPVENSGGAPAPTTATERERGNTLFMSYHKVMAHRFAQECRNMVRDAMVYLRRYGQSYEYSAVHSVEGLGCMFGVVWSHLLVAISTTLHRQSPQPMTELCLEALQIGEELAASLLVSQRHITLLTLRSVCLRVRAVCPCRSEER
eukprot:RCo034220